MLFVNFVSFVVIEGSLRAFFEGTWFTAEVSENFAGEMKRAGDQNRSWFRTGEIERFTDGLSDGDCTAAAPVAGRGSACPTNRNNVFENFRQLLRICSAFAAHLGKKN